MNLSREEKEKLVLELYYDKGYTYRQIAKELHMSPNQIQVIIRRHEEKNNTKVNKKKELSLSSKAYKLFSRGKTSVEVAILLNLPQPQATQFQYEYWKLIGLDKLVTLHALLGKRTFSFFKLYEELIIKGEMSIERVVNLIETALDKLPSAEDHYEIAKQAADRQQEKVDYLENRLHTIKKEKNRMITLPSSSYHYENDSSSSQPSPLPYCPPENYDPWSEYRNKPKKNSNKKEVYDGFIISGSYP